MKEKKKASSLKKYIFSDLKGNCKDVKKDIIDTQSQEESIEQRNIGTNKILNKRKNVETENIRKLLNKKEIMKKEQC